MEDRIFWNGIDGRSGRYFFEPMRPAEVLDLARASRGGIPRPPAFRSLPQRPEMRVNRDFFFGSRAPRPQRVRFGGLMHDVDPRDLAQSGWGAIFPERGDPAVREALRPLLEQRRAQASSRAASRFRVFSGPDGYRAEEETLDFLERHGVGPGPVDPDRMPYYLLLAGGPGEIPFDFQFQLGSQYAVGRLAFDRPEDYARYAAGLVDLERRGSAAARRVTLFGARNPDDPATRDSAAHLVEPLAQALRRKAPGWEVQTVLGEEATKKRLARLLGGGETPALLFTASHGMGLPCGDPLQLELQGALICQEWPGPEAWPANVPLPREHYFAAADLKDGARPGGLILFQYACFSAGTPRRESYARRAGRSPLPLAPRPLVARLPQRLLGHPGGTAVAVIGHVDRTWSSSFLWRRAGSQIQAFESTLSALLAGHRVGWALDAFTLRRAELAAALNAAQEKGEGDPWRLPGLWTAHNDARGFVLLGDPAARLPAATQPGRIEVSGDLTARGGA